MNPLFQIAIPRRNIHCFIRGEKFLPGMEYLSVLIEDPDAGLQRRDYCPNCWGEVEGKVWTQWKSKIPERKKENLSLKEQNERALELLREDLQEATEDSAQEAFVLGMYLKRQKILIFRQEVEQEGNFADLYEDALTEDMLLIPRVKLSGLDVDKIQQQIASKLFNELPEE